MEGNWQVVGIEPRPSYSGGAARSRGGVGWPLRVRLQVALSGTGQESNSRPGYLEFMPLTSGRTPPAAGG